MSKHPQERRDEIVDMAERLFFERGYDETTVNDIVKAVNVAQGTFYCYFKSKMEVLHAVTEKFIAQYISEVREIVDQPDGDAARQFAEVVNLTMRINPDERKLIDLLHQESNFLLHQRIMQETITRLSPLLLHIVNAGVVQGRFKVAHPREMTSLLIGAMVFLFHGPGYHAGPEEAQRNRDSLAQILTRSLGAAEGSINLDW